MKALHVTTHMGIGGIPRYIISLAKALKKRGHDCMIASSGGALEPELKKYDIGHLPIDIRTKSELSPKVVRSIFQVRRIVKDRKVDIIHAHTRVSQVVAFFVSRMTGVPYVTTCHGFFKKRARVIFDTWGSKVIAISSPVKAQLEGYLGVDEARVELVHNGVDVDKFLEDPSEEEIRATKKTLGIGDAPVVGTIGRLSDVKGQNLLIEALAGLIKNGMPVNGLIVGSGPEEAPLKDMARSLGVEKSIYFFGADPDTHKFLSAMDIFVLPSVMEGLGLSLLEAMASARPCIASKVGGIPDVIEDSKTGMLFDARDAKALSGQIVKLLNDDKLRKDLGHAARELVVKKFSADKMAGEIERVYRGVLDADKKK